jgi:hypothetical protein
MSKVVGDRLPEQITRAFDGQDLESKIGPAHLLVTTDEDGTPRPCMLSAGEVLATGDDRLRLILWSGSTTCRNLAGGGPVLFCYVVGRDLYYVKGVARTLPPAASSKLERFEIQVRAVESDRHEGMPVTAGITFGIDDLDPAKVTAGWRRQLAALRE